ncbi:hypothetical protein AB0L65_03590 [Nonomuraea sp. NPDC052116]
MRFIRRKQDDDVEPGQVTRITPAVAYDGDLYHGRGRSTAARRRGGGC